MMAHAIVEVRFEWDGADPAIEEVATDLAESGTTFPEALKDLVSDMLSQGSDNQVKRIVTLKEYT